MTFRALIIGIEEYPDVRDGSIAKSLPGTSKSASDFRDWLLAKWKAEGVKAADTQVVFCTSPPQQGGTGATSEDIQTAIMEIKDKGQNATEEFYSSSADTAFSFVVDGTRFRQC